MSTPLLIARTLDNELSLLPAMANRHGLITGAGFETPAEALYLQKELMCIPIRGQYEQFCNAAALSGFGVPVLNSINPKNFHRKIVDWLSAPPLSYRQEVNNIPEMLQYARDTKHEKIIRGLAVGVALACYARYCLFGCMFVMLVQRRSR